MQDSPKPDLSRIFMFTEAYFPHPNVIIDYILTIKKLVSFIKCFETCPVMFHGLINHTRKHKKRKCLFCMIKNDNDVLYSYFYLPFHHHWSLWQTDTRQASALYCIMWVDISNGRHSQVYSLNTIQLNKVQYTMIGPTNVDLRS